MTEVGGATSHSAIIARSYGIPLLCVPGATELVDHGDLVIVDALEGKFIVSPEEDATNIYTKKRKDWLARREETARYRSAIPVCTDGTRVKGGIKPRLSHSGRVGWCRLYGWGGLVSY